MNIKTQASYQDIANYEELKKNIIDECLKQKISIGQIISLFQNIIQSLIDEVDIT